MDMNQIVRLARDIRKGVVSTEYSMADANDVLRKAMIDANNGKNYIDPRDVRDGKCAELFAIIEQVVTEIKHDAISADPFFKQFVDYRNVALGDKLEIYAPANELYWVTEIGSGSQAIRRQRLVGGQTLAIETSWKAIKVYEEWELLMAGRIDFADVVRRIADSFMAKAYEDIYSAWTAAAAALTAPYKKTGSFVEADMLDLIQHVKAANGTRSAVIMGTMVALSKVKAANDANTQIALNDLYTMGVTGYFLGTPKVEIAQMHKAGTDTFMMADNEVYVLPNITGMKPIVYVTEGNTLILPHNPIENNDLTQEYMAMEKTGVAVRIPDGEGKFGAYVSL